MTPSYKTIRLFFFSGLFLLLAILLFDIDYKDTDKGIQHLKWNGISNMIIENRINLAFNQRIPVDFDGIDGPYILENKLYKVDSQNNFIARMIEDRDSIYVEVNNKSKDAFVVKLHNEHPIEASHYEMPRKTIIISDIEGNFDAFYGFLINNSIMDASYNWTFGDGHLVLLGDFVNRGENVTQILWLIYHLEEKAKEQSGKVHFILGNQEALKLQGKAPNLSEKYLKVAQKISKKPDWDKASKFIFSNSTELGNWMRSKNAIEKIGDYLFVHAGISPEILSYNLPLEEINQIVRENIDQPIEKLKTRNDAKVNLLLGPKGPLWYRGFITGYKTYEKASLTNLENILTFYKAEKIVVGHIFVDDISKDYGSRLIRINVRHGIEKNSAQTKGLLIQDGIEYKVNGKGERGKI